MKLGPFLGISNRRPDFDLHIKTNTTQGDYLRDAINVEIDNTGRLLRRKKATLVQAVTGPHNLHTLVTTHLFGNPYVPISSDEAEDWMRSTALGLAIFPADTPFRVQFANGTSGPWQGQLGAGFSNGTPVEISRI